MTFAISHPASDDNSESKRLANWPIVGQFVNSYPVEFLPLDLVECKEICAVRDWYLQKTENGEELDFKDVCSGEMVRYAPWVSCVRLEYTGDDITDFVFRIQSSELEKGYGKLPPESARTVLSHADFERWNSVIQMLSREKKPIYALSYRIGQDRRLLRGEALMLPIIVKGRIERVILCSSYMPTDIRTKFTLPQMGKYSY